MKSTTLLMAEHETILHALRVLDQILIEIEQTKTINDDDLRSLLAFLRDFADGSHHVKEEAIFFPALMQARISFEDGPMHVLTYEHERMRALASAMSEAFDRKNNDAFLTFAYRYIELLTEHINKENDVLFDIANLALSDDDDERVFEAFEHFENNIVGYQARKRLQTVLESLASKYLQVVV